MRQRVRKLVGTLILVAFVIVYVFLAMILGVALLPGTTKLVQIVYYVIAGFAWVLPAMALISWMQKPDKVI
ncbi:glucose dehydrogenase [Rhodobium orientis]|uniref:DUF2842 domain-containing protein n=1 Tax=Rhodobium orientis TaxID=34017 RepID=A0A327JLX8_9HYPH|nr:DUF2842 domain-containing protein [Rhodobium orientis]MBB4304779.1 glucose dehydrogenase [Rhodobium orientis]MBK5948046.1 hypothetical protein [Rhodobium orientis]RAI27480.1 hypothetical protein CH339_10345 [Rhodobium orientis]